MLYVPSVSDATATKPVISGRNLAHAQRSNPELALVGAGLHLNRLLLNSPTIRQCATLVGVCPAYVRAAVEIIDDPSACSAALHGWMNIYDAAKRSTVRESLVDHLRRSTPDELSEAARVVSPEFIWDTMVAPLMGEKEKPIAS